MAQEKQTQTSPTTWQHYTKAGAIFVATTATYLLARTTGALDSLWRWNEGDGAANDQMGETLQSAVARVVEPVGTEVATIATQGEHRMSLDLAAAPVATTQIASSLSITDWSERELPALDLQTPAAVETSISDTDESEIDIIDIPSTTTARRLLQTGSGVTVTTPIPDQVIEATAVYQYELKNIFTGNYTLMTVSLANGSTLPTWLNVKYSLVSSYDTPANARDVQVQNGIAYVADDYSGLQVLNVSNPLNITRLGSSPGSAVGAQVQNGIAYVAAGNSGLRVLNVSNPISITRLGSYYTPGSAMDVQVINGVAYVADYTSLQILNVSNPALITRLGSYNISGQVQGVQVQTGLAYMATRLPGLQILNISNPSNITYLSSYDTPGAAESMQILSGVAYVADNSGLQVLNVSNPTNITYLGNYNMPGFGPRGVQVQNGIAYVAAYWSGLQVLNISNLSNITRLGSYDTPGSAVDVQVINGVAYMADYDYGLQVIDLHQGQLSGTPTAARIGESYTVRVSAWLEDKLTAYEDFQLAIARLPRRVDTSLIDRSVLPGETLSLALDSNVLFSDPSTSTLTLRIQTSQLTTAMQLSRAVLQLNPVLLGSYDTPGSAVDVQVINGVAYVADANSLQALNINDPANIIYLGSYSPSNVASGVQVVNAVAYVANGGLGLQVFNVTNPLNITRLGSYASPGAESVQIQNGLAYVADLISGLQVLNVSNPLNIVRLGSYDTPGNAFDVQVQHGMAYVADDFSGLQILNVSNPSNITRLSSYDTPGQAWGVQVQNGVAYVADMGSGLQVLNVSNPLNITRLGSYDTPDAAHSVQVLAGLAYVADGSSGLQILNVSNPSNITRIGSYETPGGAGSVQVQHGIAYVADNFSGLQILDLTQWQWSVTPTFAEVGNYRVTVTATNELGGTASDSFELRVEGGPQLNPNITIPQLFAKVGVPFNYFIPQGLLSDPNNDPISFSARSADNSTLPGWLSFNGISATFSGLAQSSNVGNYSLRIIATDNIPGTIDAQTTFNLYVDHLPYVNQRMSDQVAGVGLPYNFTVPSSTFIDPDNGDILSYSTRQRDGSALPSWLKFNATSRQFFGVPTASDAGSYGLVLSASDNHQGEASAEFSLLVDHFPTVNLNQSLVAPVAGVGQTWAMALPPNTFIDADDTQLSYALTRVDGSTLPTWLSFNPFSGAALGVPQATDLGVNALRVIATDPHGGSAYRDFNLSVVYFPTVANAIPKPAPSRVLRPFNFTIPPQTFSDLDSPVLIYNATLSSSQPLPTWLNFNAQRLTLSGTPNVTDEGTLSLLIHAQDPAGGSIGAPLDLVIQPNFLPQLVTQISNQVANVLQPFDFFAPRNTFQDVNGDPLHYSARLAGGGHLPGWLKFDADNLRFYGTPGRSDTGDFGTHALDINLIAADDLSQTPTTFRINVQGNSHLLLALKIGGPIFTLSGLAFGLYKKRSLLLNRYQKDKYQKLDHTVVAGEAFFYPLETPPENVAKVQVKLPSNERGNGIGRVAEFFRSSHDRLPGHVALPSWMDYDTEKNALFSLGPVPASVKHKTLIIQVKDKDNITQEEFTLKVLPAAQHTLIDDEAEKPESKAKVEVIEEGEVSESASLQSASPASANVPVSNNRSAWFKPSNAGAKAQDHLSRMPQPPMEEIELETIPAENNKASL
jgi:hypothetical protein